MIQNLKICSEIVAQKLMNIIWQCYLKKIPQVGFGAIFGLILGHLGRFFGINLENIILWISQLNNWFWIIVCSAKSPSLASASSRFSGTLFGMLLGKLFLFFFGNSWNDFLDDFLDDIFGYGSLCIVQILLYWHPLPQDFGWNMTAGSRVRGRVVVKSLT